jgi:hypothetical protein
MEQHTFQSENIEGIIAALVKFQIKFQNVKLEKDKKNEHLKNKYVSFDNILHTCRPLLSECGLVVVQAMAGDYLVTTIYHTSGQYIGAKMPFSPMQGNKGTNSLQDLGGGITYAKRYQFSAMLNISVDVDDDAQSSTKVITQANLKTQKTQKTVNEEQFTALVAWIQAVESEKTERMNKAFQSYQLTIEQKDTISSL